MERRLLITKPITDIPLLEKFCDVNNIRLIAHSFIEFCEVRSEIPEGIRTLFFGSRRAMDFFLKRSEIPADCEIACIGDTTRKYIENLGYTVHFCGTKAGDPESVAEELRSWLGERKLHIAQSEQSNRSMAKALPPNQTEEIIVYQTIPVSHSVPENLDWIAFTSPSNLEGFLLSNSIDPGNKVIVWGKTTEKSLMAHGFTAEFVLENSSETELISILEQQLSARN